MSSSLRGLPVAIALLVALGLMTEASAPSPGGSIAARPGAETGSPELALGAPSPSAAPDLDLFPPVVTTATLRPETVVATPTPRPTPPRRSAPRSSAPRTTASTSLPAGLTPAARSVIQAALNHLGAPYVFGATGPTTFDCSGLVWFAFRSTGHFAIIGNGAYRGGSAIYGYFLRRGLASRSGGRPGDIVAYDGGMHVGIYLGNGRVISALTRGVSIHGLYAVNLPFTAFLHTGLDG